MCETISVLVPEWDQLKLQLSWLRRYFLDVEAALEPDTYMSHLWNKQCPGSTHYLCIDPKCDSIDARNPQ